MADEFQLGSGNWWDTPRNTNFETQATAISTTLNTIASYGWPMEMATAAAADIKSRSSIDSGAGAAMIRHGQSSGGVGQIMGLGLSDWNQNQNQAFDRGDKAESSFRPLIHEDFGPNTVDFQQAESRRTTPYQELWRQQNQGFALDQTQFSSNDSTMTSQNLAAAAAAYVLLPSENHQQPYQNRQMNYPYPSNEYSNYPPFLRTSSPKQTPMEAADVGVGSHLHFSNNTPFWNASAMAEARPAFFPDVQKQIPAPPSFDEKAKSLSEIREVGSTMKKTTVESSNKRPRSDSTSPLPAFKVRKEKMGDRITALQQLVSPFGKTDTASVLSEAIEYIKYLHEQVSVLSAPYMKHAAPIQHHQTMDRSKDGEGTYQDLRSRGLCLVPVTSTFPVTHESTVDFWTPTFGGTFR